MAYEESEKHIPHQDKTLEAKYCKLSDFCKNAIKCTMCDDFESKVKKPSQPNYDPNDNRLTF